MGSSNWERLKVIFDEAIALPPGERTQFIENTCSDPGDREELIELLSYHDEDSDFLETPMEEHALYVIGEALSTVDEGQRIGPYRLIREIGHGGMGVVYLAERADGAYDQKVAIKLVSQIGPGDELLRRLQQERQILASLQHPHIARLLDGGLSSDGHPYLVMEYVEGVAVDQYCDQHRLGITKKLQLFQAICDAVHYAHQNLVVHRDIKPSNILVTEDGQVKLLDFGIAKLQDEQQPALQTRADLRLMTPEYASPEQVKGRPVTTATDTYALGVVLYKLLTGKRPYEVRDLSPGQVERVICEELPPRPSTQMYRHGHHEKSGKPDRLHRLLKGDLDIIVMKALHKEPGRRYVSVQQFRDDIHRHLHKLPITARPDSVRYRAGRFVQRHTVGVIAIVAIVIALIGGMVTTARQARIAAEARNEAEQRFDAVRSLANTLLFDFHDAIRDLPGATPARRLLVEHARQYLDSLSQDVGDEPALQSELASAYERVGEVQGDPHFPNLGDMAGAEVQYRNALAIRRALWLNDTTDIHRRRDLANTQARLAVVLSWSGDNETAIEVSKQALTLLRPLVKSGDIRAQHDAGRIRSELGWWLVFAGRIPDALAELAVARHQMESIEEILRGQVDYEIDLWRVYTYQVDALRWSSRAQEALNMLEEIACPRLERLMVGQAFNPRLQASLQSCYSKVGGVLQAIGASDQALRAYQNALDIAEAIQIADTANADAYGAAGVMHEAIGDLMMEMGRPADAIERFEAALFYKRKVFLKDPENGEAGSTLANTMRSLCTYYTGKTMWLEAEANCRESISVLESAVKFDEQNVIGNQNLALSHIMMARVYRGMGEVAHRQDTNADSLFSRALHHYNEATRTYDAISKNSDALRWTIHPDTLLNERDELKGFFLYPEEEVVEGTGSSVP